jgi:hypothetical protein
MAKSSEGNPFLLHVEKLVLAVCLVTFVATVFLYPMSESTVDLDKQKMAPDKVDAYLVKLIDQMGTRTAASNLEPEPDYLAILHRDQDPDLSDSRWAMLDLSTPTRWIPSEKEKQPGQNKLRSQPLVDLIPKPDKPLVGIAAEYRDTDPPSDAVVAHSTALFPAADLLERWQEAMKESILASVVNIVDVRFERQEAQEVLPDGTIVWGPSAKVEGVFRPLKDKDGKEVLAPTWPEVTKENVKEAQKFINDYFINGFDKYKAEPDYWDVLSENQWMSWRINLPLTELNARPTVEPAGTGGTSGGSSEHTTLPPSPGPGNQGNPPRSGAAGPGDPRGASANPGRQGGMGASPPGSSPKSKTGTRPPRFVAPTSQPGRIRLVSIPTSVPDWEAQTHMKTLGKIQVWGHDASLEYLKTYRYRAQVVLLNPLYTYLGEVLSAEDALKPTVESPWSDWSDPVKPPPQADLFLTGSAQQMKNVTVTVFSRCQGQRVSHPFDVKVGDRIGEKVGDKIVKTIDVDVPDLKNPGKTIKKPCNFFTGYTMIDINWDRTVFQNGVPMKTVEIVLMDDLGNLVVRNKALDGYSSEYKALQAETETVQTVRPPPIKKEKEPTTKPHRTSPVRSTSGRPGGSGGPGPGGPGPGGPGSGGPGAP